MTRAARGQRAAFAFTLALFGLGWSGSGTAAASAPIESAAQTGAVYLHLREVGLLSLAGPGQGLCSKPLPPLTKEQANRGHEEIQLAGPVRRSMRRTARRTARRTSRRQAAIHD